MISLQKRKVFRYSPISADFLCLYNSTGSGESDSSRADVPVVITYMAGSRSVQKKWKLPCQRCANFVLSLILRVFCDFLKTSLRWIFRSAWSNLVTIRLHVFWRDNNGRFKWKGSHFYYFRFSTGFRYSWPIVVILVAICNFWQRYSFLTRSVRGFHEVVKSVSLR